MTFLVIFTLQLVTFGKFFITFDLVLPLTNVTKIGVKFTLNGLKIQPL